MISLMTILGGTMFGPYYHLLGLFLNLFVPRYYTWIKTTEQARPLAWPVDVETLNQVNEKMIDWRAWKKVIRLE